MLADPAEPGIARQRLLQHRRRIGEDAMAEGPDRFRDPIRQPLQPVAQHLVVVATQRIARDIAKLRQPQHLVHRPRLGQVIEPHRDHAQRAGHQRLGLGALGAVARHPVHLAVESRGQPLVEALRIGGEIGPGDADLLKAQFCAPGTDAPSEACGVDGGAGGAHQGMMIGGSLRRTRPRRARRFVPAIEVSGSSKTRRRFASLATASRRRPTADANVRRVARGYAIGVRWIAG